MADFESPKIELLRVAEHILETKMADFDLVYLGTGPVGKQNAR